jgi:hypothetical protein
MNEMLYNLLNSEAFWVIVAIWLFACIAWTTRWKAVLERIGKLVIKPIIFKRDPNPDNVPLYPRTLFEDVSNGIRNTLRQPFTDFIKWLREKANGMKSLIYSEEHPFRTFGYILLLVLFIFFVTADAIAVANTLYVLHLWQGEMPEILTRFDIAVFGGSLAALIIGLAIVLEIRSKISEFTFWSERDERVRSLVMGASLLVTVLSFVTLIAWALFRMIELHVISSSPFLNGLLNWILFGLVPINSALAAAIVFLEAIRGVIVVGILIIWLVIGILYLLDYAATIFGSVGPFLFDIAYRIIYIIIDVFQWLVTTPVHVIVLPFKLIAGIFTGTQGDTSHQSK